MLISHQESILYLCRLDWVCVQSRWIALALNLSSFHWITPFQKSHKFDSVHLSKLAELCCKIMLHPSPLPLRLKLFLDLLLNFQSCHLFDKFIILGPTVESQFSWCYFRKNYFVISALMNTLSLNIQFLFFGKSTRLFQGTGQLLCFPFFDTSRLWNR